MFEILKAYVGVSNEGEGIWRVERSRRVQSKAEIEPFGASTSGLSDIEIERH